MSDEISNVISWNFHSNQKIWQLHKCLQSLNLWFTGQKPSSFSQRNRYGTLLHPRWCMVLLAHLRRCFAFTCRDLNSLHMQLSSQWQVSIYKVIIFVPNYYIFLFFSIIIIAKKMVIIHQLNKTHTTFIIAFKDTILVWKIVSTVSKVWTLRV